MIHCKLCKREQGINEARQCVVCGKWICSNCGYLVKERLDIGHNVYIAVGRLCKSHAKHYKIKKIAKYNLCHSPNQLRR